MEKLIKELEELKSSRIAASQANQRESVDCLNSLIEMKVNEIVEKQKRIDSYAIAQLHGIEPHHQNCREWFEQCAVKNIWDIAEAMEAERERRINALNK